MRLPSCLMNFAIVVCVLLSAVPLAAQDLAAQDLAAQDLAAQDLAAQDTVLSQAVVHLSFDEDTGPALDSGKASRHPDNGTLVNDPVRVASPFWNQSGKKALLLDANRKQYMQFGESLEVDRPDAVTVSCFALNLHEPNDGAFHGLFAKRFESGGTPTNYGINYQPSGDVFQVYFNDTGGYRIAFFSVKAAIGSRRLNYLTTVWEVGDAPEPDADTDKDDVRVALFLNGKPLKPTNVTPNGRIVVNDVWFTDIQVAKLLNDTPLTIGASHPTIEHTSLLVDEFSVFAKALTAEQIAKLFVEVAGPNAEQLAQQEMQPPPTAVPAPQLQRLSQYGLQRGLMTRLVLFGQNLQPESAKVHLPGVDLAAAVQPDSSANQLVLQVAVPGDAPSGLYPIRVVTAAGVSNAEGLAIDDLPQRVLNVNAPEQPVALPAAFSGNISGGEQVRIFFEGRLGQRIVADVESRRLRDAADMNPVLELKTARGTPVKIAWETIGLSGDARIDTKLPADGIYFIELHELQYRAPGATPFRLKLGDIPLVDAFFPPFASIANTKTSFELIGTGLISPQVELSQPPVGVLTELTSLPKIRKTQAGPGPLPLLRMSNAIEVVEATQPASGPLQSLDARFESNKHVPLVFNGRISSPGEEDKFLLNVTPGQTLSIVVDAQTIGSPLDPELQLLGHPQGNGLAGNDDRPGTRDPGLDYAVPQGVTAVQVVVRDLHRRGGSHFIYRVRVHPAGQQTFQLAMTTPAMTLADNGTALLELQLTRNGYAGPIHLKVLGDDRAMITPSPIPPSVGNGKLFVTLARQGDNSQGLKMIRIVGESEGLTPPLRAIAVNAANSKSLLGHQELLPLAVSGTSLLRLTSVQPPPTLFRGLPADVSVTAERLANAPGASLPVMLSLTTTEEPRKIDPNNPNSPLKPLVSGAPNQSIASGTTTGQLRINVPLDVAAAMIECVVKAEIVPHAYSSHVLGQVFSSPFFLPVQNAAAVSLDANTLSLIAGQPNKVLGTVKRTAPFVGNIDVSLIGLPNGYSAPKATVPRDKEQFELVVTAAAEAAAKDIPNVTLRVEATGVGMILPDNPVALKVVGRNDRGGVSTCA